MPLPSYQTIPLPPFSAMQPSALGHSIEYDRVLTLLHDVDERVAELYPQLSDHWLQSELYAFLHVKDELVSRVKKRATRKHSVAAGAAERRKELRVSTSAATPSAAATAAAAVSLTSPDSRAVEIAKGHVPHTPANEAMAATPARHHSKSLAKAKSAAAIVSNKQRVSAVLKELAGEEGDNTTTAVAETYTAPAAAVVAALAAGMGDNDEESKEAEVISPLPQVNTRTGSSAAAKGRTGAALSLSSKQRTTDSKRLTTHHSSSNTATPLPPSSIPVFTASAATVNRKKAAVPAFAARKGGRLAIETPAPGQTARVLQEEHAELAHKLDELQSRHKQLADKQDKYIKKREREDEERRKREEEAAVAAPAAAAEAALQSAAVSATVDGEVDSGELLRAPPSPGRLAPLPQDDPTSPRSPRHTPTSSVSNVLSPLSSARPLRPHSPSLPPLVATSSNLSPLTARVAAAPLSARDQIVQPTAHFNDEAQRGTVCSGLLLCAPTPRLLLRPSTQEMEDRLAEKTAQHTASATEQSVEEAELEPSTDEQMDDQQPATVEADPEPTVQSLVEADIDATHQQESEPQPLSTTTPPASRFVDLLTVDVPNDTAPPLSTAATRQPPASSLSPASSSHSSRSSSPLAGTGTPRTLRPSTAEMSNAAAVLTSPPTPSARSRMVHRAGQPLGLTAVLPISPAGLPPSSASARSRATSNETGKAVYEESFPTIGSRRASLGREEAAVVAEAVKGLGNLVENNRIEAAVEAAEERIKKERWMAVMRDIEKRKRRGGGTGEGEEVEERQRRHWRDESLITASDLRKQIAMMGIRMDDIDETRPQPLTQPADTTNLDTTSTLSTVDPLSVPLPATARTALPTARTASSTRPATSTSTMEEATLPSLQADNSTTTLSSVDPLDVPLPPTARTASSTRPSTSLSAADDSSTERQPVSSHSAVEEVAMSAVSVVDPSMVPLPLSSRTAVQTARTARSARLSDESAPVDSTADEQQSTDSGDVASMASVSTVTETAAVVEQQQPVDNDEVVEQPAMVQSESDESTSAVQAEETVDSDIQAQAEGSSETAQSAVEASGEIPVVEGSSE